MTNERDEANGRSRFRLLLLICVLLVSLWSPTIASATPPTALTDQTTTEQAASSDGVLSVTVDGPAVLHRKQFVYVWSRPRLDVTVGLDSAADGRQVCLYRQDESTAAERLRCRELDDATSDRTLTFEGVGTAGISPTTYRFAARLFDANNRTAATAASPPVVELLDWRAVENETLGKAAAERGLVSNVTNVNDSDSSSPTPDHDETPARSTTAAAENGSKAAVQGEPEQPNEGASNVTVPGVDGYVDLPGPPIVLLSGGGLLALLALLYVQRDGSKADGETPEWIDGKRSDADRVAALLAEHDGQMKQSEIVEATEWSKAKVSRLLSRMDDHDRIRKRQDGRQNIIILRRRA